MRLYRIENMSVLVNVNEEIIEMTALIVPENALGEYEFSSCEYIGDLDDAFEITRKKTDNDPEGKVVKLKKDD